jgi:hypothetical protein
VGRWLELSIDDNLNIKTGEIHETKGFIGVSHYGPKLMPMPLRSLSSGLT